MSYTQPIINNPDFVLGEDGLTCLCPDADFGDLGTLTINGVQKTFTKRSRTQLDSVIANDIDNPQIALTCTSGITDMTSMFSALTGIDSTFNQNLENWDVSNVTNMNSMFVLQSSFNQPLNNWDVSNVTNMFQLFAATGFNQPLDNWDVSNVTNMDRMFLQANAFNQPLNDWDVSNVTNMNAMFNVSAFNHPLDNWDVSNVTIMSFMFAGISSFNQPVNMWDVSNVTNMSFMFADSLFNQPLDGWDVSQVTNMRFMFLNTPFNQPLNNWDVSNVVDMAFMFNQTSSFNQPLNNWDVSNVTDMFKMFEQAVAFNQPLDNWNVTAVTNMTSMFSDSNFNQDISSWCVEQIPTEPEDFSLNAPLQNDFKPSWGTTCNLPNAIAQDITVQLDENGQVSITPAMVNNGSTVSFGVATLSLDITDFDCSNLGPNTVTLTVTDQNNNSDTAIATVTVISSVPTNFVNTAVTATSADFSWISSDNTVNGYEIQVFNFGEDPNNDTAVSIGTISDGTVTTGTVTGLTQETTYDAYIKSDFGGGNYSCWSSAVSFTTLFDFCISALVNDSGGTSGNYPNNANEIIIICPNNLGDKVVINFSEFSFEGSSSGCLDSLTVYDGNSTTATTINPPGSGTEWCWDRNDDTPSGTGDLFGVSIAATSVSGCITLKLNSNGSQTREGFTAKVSCESTVYLWDGSAWTTSPEGSITSSSNLYINVGSTPSLTDGISTKSVFIDNGAMLNVSSGSIEINQNLNNYGSITGSSDILMSNSSNQSINGSGIISNLTVNNSNGISINGKQDITGILNLTNGDINITSNSNLTFKSDASGTAQLADANGNSITGDVSIERFIPVATEDSRAFRFLTSAVDSNDPIYDNWQENGNSPDGYGTHITGNNDGTNGVDQTVSGNPSMFTFDNEFIGDQINAWIPITNTKAVNLIAGEAYVVFIRGDRNYDLNSNPIDNPNSDVTLRATGDLVIGDFTHNLSDIENYFSLIGNPYQAIVDINNVSGSNFNLNAYYVWDPNMSQRGAYVTVSLPSGTNPGTSDADQFVQPGQSFFVQTLNNGTANLTFSESAKNITATPTSIFSNNDQTSINLLLYNHQALITNDSEADALGINFNPNGNNGVDQMDAVKLNNPDENLARLSNSEHISIESRAMPVDGESLELFTNGYTESDYSFVANVSNLPNDVDAYLVDNYTGNQILLLDEANTINFTVDASIPESIATNRFSIDFEVVTLGVNVNELGYSFKVYPNPVTDQLRIIASQMAGENVEVILYDIVGKRLMQTQNKFESKGEMKLNIGTNQAGIYFIEIKNNGKTGREKLIIK